MTNVRTTINIDDDALPAIKKYADSRSIALGKAVSDLVRRGLSAPVATRLVNGVHVVVLPGGSPAIEAGRVKNLIEDELK
jgi:hypothetical protein